MNVRLPNPLIGVVWLAFLIPAAGRGGWVDPSFGVAVFLLGCAVLVAKPSPWEARKTSALALRLFLLLEILYLFSTLYSAAFNGIQFRLRDCLELLRYVFLGVFVVYLIRHYDAGVRLAMEWAMTAAVYCALLFPIMDPQGYVSVMTLCFLLFFSRLRLRFLHAATALLVIFFSGAGASLAAALFILSAAFSVGFYRSLARRRVKSAARASAAFCAVLLGGAAFCLRLKIGAAAAAADPALQFIRRSPILGWGTAEGQWISSGVNQYLRWLLDGGALGTGVILTGLFIAGYRLLRDASGDLWRVAGAVAFLGSVGLMLTAGQFLESFRLFFLTAFFIADMYAESR